MRGGYQLFGYVTRRITVALALLIPATAQAHVKWFCAYDVAGQPVGLENVLCTDFEELVGLSMALLLFGAVIERTALGQALVAALDTATAWLRRNTELLVRATTAVFFMSIATMLHVLLTPELFTDQIAVNWLQAGIAVSMLSRRTMPAGAAGIVLLFAMAVGAYGTFHLMDYPIFLGLAAYLALIGLGRAPFGIRPLDIMRWAAAVTLMWASIEKWAYPEWTFPLFIQHPEVSMGMDVQFYMRAAGTVEFALAFALLLTPLMRRISATILTGTFVAAIGEFGLIDAIGHSCIIAILIAILADNAKQRSSRRSVILMPLTYSGTLTLFLVGYYALHSLMFGTTIG